VLRHTLGEAFGNLWRHRFVNLLAAGTIALSLLLLGVFLLAAHNLARAVADLGSQVTVSVYLRDDAGELEREMVLETIGQREETGSVEYVSPEAAREKFRRLFPSLREVPDTLEENPFPASVEIAVKEGYRDPETVRRLAEEVRRLPGVEDAVFDLPWVAKLRDVVRLARAAGYSIGGMVGFAAILTIASVIRMTVYSRQQEIEILRLVGATRGFIIAPFLLEASLLGALGGGLALAGLGGIYRFLERRPEAVVPLFREVLAAAFLPGSTCALLVVMGVFAGALGGTLSLRRVSM
jgi:cell division transport system permease protein